MKIGIIANRTRQSALEAAGEVVRCAQSLHMEVLPEDKLTAYPQFKGLTTLTLPELCDTADYLVVLGGDGTILRVAQEAAIKGKPVMGVNWGVLGFLAELDQSYVGQAMYRLATGDFALERRDMLQVCCYGEDAVLGPAHGLNDVSLVYSPGDRIFRSEVWVNDQLLGEVTGDGLLISTPTGSTAYSLSCGGPAVDPEVDCMVITPVAGLWHAFPPTVAPGSARIVLRPVVGRDGLKVCADGKVQYEIFNRQRVEVQKSDFAAQFVRFSDFTFYDHLRQKLMPHQRQPRGARPEERVR